MGIRSAKLEMVGSRRRGAEAEGFGRKTCVECSRSFLHSRGQALSRMESSPGGGAASWQTLLLEVGGGAERTHPHPLAARAPSPIAATGGGGGPGAGRARAGRAPHSALPQGQPQVPQPGDGTARTEGQAGLPRQSGRGAALRCQGLWGEGTGFQTQAVLEDRSGWRGSPSPTPSSASGGSLAPGEPQAEPAGDNRVLPAPAFVSRRAQT